MLLLLSYRSEYIESNELLRRLKAQNIGTEIEVAPLSREHAAQLAQTLLGPEFERDIAEAIARESQGSPLFVGELARHARRGGKIGANSFEEMLRERRDALPEQARQLLDTLVVVGRPIADKVAFHASGLALDPDVIGMLRNGLWIRTAATEHATQLEPYHDRIRELLVAKLAPATLVDRHRNIARALLEASASPDPEQL